MEISIQHETHDINKNKKSRWENSITIPNKDKPNNFLNAIYRNNKNIE